MNGQHDGFLDELPNGWNFDRLKDVVTLRKEKNSDASEDDDYLELEDIESGTGHILRRRNTLEVESAVTMFKRGDVLFGKLRPYLEKYYEAEFDGKCTGEILAFTPERITSRFLFYCVGSRWFIERCNALAYGAKMPRVSWSTQLSQFNVPLPPLPEQQRIAAYLYASCAAIDAAVAAKRRQIDTLGEIRKSTIQSAVTQGLNQAAKVKCSSISVLGEIPAHWRIDRLKDVSAINSSSLAADTDPDYEFDYLEISNVNYHGIVDVNAIERVRFEDAPSRARRRVATNSTLISSVRPNLQAVAFVFESRKDFVCSTGFNVVQPNEDILWPKFVFYALISEGGRQYFKSTAKGVGYPAVDDKDFGTIDIPLPPISEQVAICAYLDAKLDEVKRLVGGIESQIATLTAYRKSLIHECVTGQRRVTEADIKLVEAHG
ncbi:MAG: hypothetical protein CVU77_04395 [Elusimicrobia bacterium HGW-Elusimicrobia-1]|jgi:type I restriction enzyme S subunit|nr:MAG: hypothetical protein CVU77_04395 [Elusimicrobia bacterium HGW-Elusimicrobia-1]